MEQLSETETAERQEGVDDSPGFTCPDCKRSVGARRPSAAEPWEPQPCFRCWLASLKVGDEVAVYGWTPQVGRIEAVHKIHFVVNKTKYRRDSGRSAGDDYYNRTHIEPVTPEFLHDIKVRRAKSFLNHLDTTKFSDAAVIRIAKFVRKEIEAAKLEGSK